MSESALFRPGLVSITFRKLSTAEIISLVSQAGLVGIEWGGDVHVPAGQIDVAKDVGRRTRDAGLRSAAYGSYYRLGVNGPDVFPAVLETAVALGTKIIRVWPGTAGSASTDDAGRARVVEDGRRIGELAAAAGVTIACEWHGGTLTDSADSAARLFAAIDHPAFKTYWQPHQRMSAEQCLIDLNTALPRLVGLHVFQWHEQTVERQPLSEGAAVWRRYFGKARTAKFDSPPFALLEFVRNDDPAQFLLDAAELKRWLADWV